MKFSLGNSVGGSHCNRPVFFTLMSALVPLFLMMAFVEPKVPYPLLWIMGNLELSCILHCFFLAHLFLLIFTPRLKYKLGLKREWLKIDARLTSQKIILIVVCMNEIVELVLFFYSYQENVKIHRTPWE